MLRTRLIPALIAGLFALVLVSPASAQSGGEAASDTPPARDALTDANIAAIVVVANTADVENGRLALERSSNEAVKAFARTMVTDHPAVNEQAAQLVAKLGVSPQPGPASADLESGTDVGRDRTNVSPVTAIGDLEAVVLSERGKVQIAA